MYLSRVPLPDYNESIANDTHISNTTSLNQTFTNVRLCLVGSLADNKELFTAASFSISLCLTDNR